MEEVCPAQVPLQVSEGTSSLGFRVFGIYLLLTTNNNCLKPQGKYLEVTRRPLLITRGHRAVFSKAVWPPAKWVVTQCLQGEHCL